MKQVLNQDREDMFAVNNWIYQNRQIVQVTTHHFKVNSKCVVNLLYKDKQCKERKAQRKVIKLNAVCTVLWLVMFSLLAPENVLCVVVLPSPRTGKHVDANNDTPLPH